VVDRQCQVGFAPALDGARPWAEQFGADARGLVGGAQVSANAAGVIIACVAVRPAAVVILSEVLDHHLRLGQAAEHLSAESLVADALLNDSTNGFFHGEPGRMNAAPVRLKRHQSRSAWEVISGPLSRRTNSG
jgi:hypothetical protein